MSNEFETIQSQIQALYQAGDYEAAYQLASQHAGDFPEHDQLFVYWRICMAAGLGKPDLANNIFENALQDGNWFGEVLLRKSPALQSLQGTPTFEQLVARNQALYSQDQSQAFPMLILRPQGECNQGDLPCPTLMGLHANSGTIQSSLDFWKPAAEAGWLVAAPQSTQAIWKDAYIWDDLEIARQQVAHHFVSLNSQYAIDPFQSVIAGHSMGAEVAIYLALTGAVPAVGFLAISPSGPLTEQPDNWRLHLAKARQRLESGRGILRGYILLGEQDDSVSKSGIEALLDMLFEAGIACDLEIIQGAGHEYSPHYKPALFRALDFITDIS